MAIKAQAEPQSPILVLGKSDDLPKRRRALRLLPIIPPSQRLPEPTLLIVDSNFVLKAIRSKARCEPPRPRTAFEEALDAKVIAAFAPPLLIEEVERHLPRMAEEIGRSLSVLLECWVEIGSRIGFIKAPYRKSTDIEAVHAIDPDDVPFAQLLEHLQARTILSDDKVWRFTTYPVLSETECKRFVLVSRDAARHGSTVLGSRLLATGTAIVGTRLLEWASQHPVITGILLIIIGLLGYHASQSAPNSSGADLLERIEAAILPLLPDLHGESLRGQTGLAVAMSELEKILSRLPQQPKLTLGRAALMACALAKRPQTEKEILEAVPALGYKSQSTKTDYLRQVLRKRTELVEVSDRSWQLRPEFTVTLGHFEEGIHRGQ